MTFFFNNLKEKISFTEKSFLISAIIKGIGVIISLLLSRHIAKLFSVELFGFFNLFESYLQILVVLSLFGSRQLIVKKVSILFVNKNYIEIQSWFMSSITAISLTSLIVLLIYNFILNYFLPFPKTVKIAFQIGGFIIYIKVILFILSSFYSSHNKLWQSTLVDRAVLPFIFLSTLFFVNKFSFVSFIDLFFIYLSASLFFLVFVFAYWIRFSNKINFNYDSISLKKVFNVEATLFLILSFLGLFFFKMDIMVLGLFGSSYDLGIYSAGAKVAFLLNFFTPVIHSIYTPRISILNSKNDFLQIKQLFYVSIKILLSLGFLIFILLIIFGKDILSFWGLEYIKAYKILLLLSFSNIISMSMSMCLPIIMMCDLEKKYLKNLFFLIVIALFFLKFILSNFDLESFTMTMSFFIITESVMKLFVIRKNLFKNL